MFVLITSGLSLVIQRTKPFHKIHSNCALVTIPDSLKNSPGLVSDKKNKTSSNKGKHNSNYTNIMLKKKNPKTQTQTYIDLSQGLQKYPFKRQLSVLCEFQLTNRNLMDATE